MARNFDCSWNFKAFISASTFSMILSFLPNCTPCCSRDTFMYIDIEINSATKATDSSLRASASVAMYSFPNSFPFDNLVIYPCSKSNIHCGQR